MRQLTGQDAIYFHIETPRQPMHITSILFFTPSGDSSQFDYHNYKDFFASRLHLVDTFRQRIIHTPLKLDHPYWIEDPDFDINFHLHRFALPKPGGWKEFCNLHSHIFAQPLDKTRPLWEIYLVEGLDTIKDLPKGSFALIVKAHHAAIDGVSGANMISEMFNKTPEFEPPKTLVPWNPEPAPTDKEMLKQMVINTAKQPRLIANVLSRLVSDAQKLKRFALKEKKEIKDFYGSFEVPRTRFNTTITSRRSWDGIELPLQEVRSIGKALHEKVTINDVMLTICSGALRYYLQEKNELPDIPLVTAIPVSVRKEHERSNMGNRISMMYAQLATMEADPGERLKVMHKNALLAKKISKQQSSEMYNDSLQILPNLLGEKAVSFYYQTQDSIPWPIKANLTITNVPGPRENLYMPGAQLKSIYLAAPSVDSLGLFIGIFSYMDTITINAICCHEIMPDAHLFAGYLSQAFSELCDIYL